MSVLLLFVSWYLVPPQVFKLYLVQKTLTYILMLKSTCFVALFNREGSSGADDPSPCRLYNGHTNTLGSKSMISNKNLNKNVFVIF